jgi:gamma-butyrobetaine dioxygenase
MGAIVGEIFELFARFGSERYGEALSLEAHMLQSAAHAEAKGAAGSVVAAALLHDIGYFLQARAELSPDGRDTEHEAVAATWLSQAFGPEVTAPIALHVRAKQYLCAVEPDYYDRLSDASRRTLVTQGGVMSRDEAEAFARHPAFGAAVLLRRCDDLGKDPSAPIRRLEDYRELLLRCRRLGG